MKRILVFTACLLSLFFFSVPVHAIPYTSSFVGAVSTTFFTPTFPDEIIQPGDRIWGDYTYDVPTGHGGAQVVYFNLNVEVLSGDLILTYWGDFIEDSDEVWMSGTYPALDITGMDVGRGGSEMGEWYRDNHGVEVVMGDDQDIYTFDIIRHAHGSGSISGGSGAGEIYGIDPVTGDFFYTTGMYSFSYDFHPVPEPAAFFLFGVGLALLVRVKIRRDSNATQHNQE